MNSSLNTKTSFGSKKRFLAALSFPGDHRALVGKVAECLAGELTNDRVLYDEFHRSEFARPNLDTYLQALYHDQSELVVVFCAVITSAKSGPALNGAQSVTLSRENK